MPAPRKRPAGKSKATRGPGRAAKRPGPRRAATSAAGKRSVTPKGSSAKKSSSAERSGDFRTAFAALLRSRKITVPKGLLEAPPEAYASQPASVVEQLEGLGNADLKRYAEKVAGYAQRQADRARKEWESSPLIAELRRRGLREPPAPVRPVGVSVSLAKPLKQWSDKELLKAASDWSKLGSR